MRSAHLAAGGQVIRTFSGVENLHLVSVPATTNVHRAIAAYRSNPNVLYAEPNYIVHSFQTPNDPLFPNMWALLNTGQNGGTAGADIKATQAWNITTGSSSVVIAVLDTGIDYNHPDLAANVFSGPICPNATVCHGIDTVPGAQNPNDPLDDNGHGTHVSGTIGAIGNNSLGVTGINWNVTILPCKFLDATGAGSVASAIQCLDFIKGLKDSQGLNIVASNNSWGGTDFSQALQDAIDRQLQSGILFIAAAGNSFADNDITAFFPANTPLPNVISVAATDRNDHRAFFSDIGRHTVHLGAPGQDILSTLPGGTYGLDSGTSMATPHVTGVAALLAAQDPTRDWRAIKNLILTGGDPDTDLAATVSGRRLNAFGALTCSNSTVASRLAPATDIVSGSVGVPIVLSALNINCDQPNGAVQVTVTPGGQTIQLSDNGTAPDVAAGDGIYSGSFTPSATGVYTLTFSTGDTATVQVLNNYQGTAAAFNYRTITGTNLNLTDDGVAHIVSPFPVPFGDGSFTDLWVSANGIISFDGAVSSYLHMILPTGVAFPAFTQVVQANSLVAPFWDDLVPQAGTAQNVFWDVSGTAPNRELVVEWRNLPTFDCFNEPDTVKFQAVFFENSSNVLFNYADAVFGGSCISHDRGGSATIGIQISANTGTMWGFDGQDVDDGVAVLWTTSTTPPTLPPTPVLTSISPTTVSTFGPAFVLTVNGSNFTQQSRVTLFGEDRFTTFVNANQLTTSIPATDLDPFVSAASQIQVIVINRTTQALIQSSPLILNVTPPTPILNSLSPASVPPSSFGFQLNLNGDDFTPGAVVNVNGQPVNLFANTLNRNLIQAIIPSGLVTGSSASITVTDFEAGTSNPVILQVSASAPPPPIAPGLGYRILQTPTSRTIVPGSPNPVTGRFLGWNLARAQGTKALSQFVRLYAPLFTAGKENASSLAHASGAAVSTPALPGLDLPTPLAAGFLPTGVAVGDFNHDGHLDWVVSNGGSNDLWLYLGNGDGTVQAPHIIPLNGQSPVGIAAADLRGTGVLDLVVVEPDSLTVGVLLGNGDGTFAPEQLYFVPATPLSLTIADFNRDGHPDVVVGLMADDPLGAVAFFAGDGSGKLLPPVTTPLERQFSPAVVAVAITSGDLNNDGIPDLLITDQNPIDPGTYVYLGQGDGTFKASQNLGGILNAAIGDLNGDGCPDVVTIDFFGEAATMLGHCDGTFQLLSPLGFFGEGETGISMALADVNGDGKLDLITSGINLAVGGPFGQDSGSLVSVSFGDGAGGFAPASVYRAQSGMFGLAVGDFNGDSHPDVVVASQDTDSVFLLTNDGTGKFAGPRGRYLGWLEKGSPANNFLQGPANAPVTLLAADVDGDGKKDMVAVDFGLGADLPFNLVVSLNDGQGNFLPDKKVPVLDSTQIQFFGNMVLGNFRGTGLPDVVLTPNHLSGTFSGNFYVFVPNLGGGNFGTPVATTISGFPGAIAAGDFNGDGKLDFAMVGGSPGQIVTFLGHGDGNFTPGPSQPFSNAFPPQSLLTGDFNGDGKLDILVPIRNQLFELLGKGDGTFSAPILLMTVSSGSDASLLFQVADLNHDGRTDLIQRNGVLDGPTPVFKIYLAQPDGSFVLQNTYSPYSGLPLTGEFISSPAANNFVGDFNGDGIPDIAAFQGRAAAPAEQYVQFMLGNGDGTFTPTFQRFHLGGNAALPSFITDLNGDGKADFVELDGFTSAFNVIRSVPGSPFALQFVSLPVVGSNGTVRATLALPAAQDTALQLSASDPAITIPASLTVPAGSLSADTAFTVGQTFDTSHAFTITATNGSASSTATGSVAAPGGAVGFVAMAGSLFDALLPGQTSGNLGYTVVSRAGYQTTVSLSCTNVPPGITCQLGAQSLDVLAGGSNGTSLIVAVDKSVPVGNYTFNVVTQDSSISQSVTVKIPVGDFALQLVSTGNSALPTGFETFQLDLTSINNFQNAVNFSCSGLPLGTTCIAGNGIAGVGSGNVGILVDTSNVPVGNYQFSIVGDTGFTTHSVPATLHVGGVGGGTVTPSSATLSVGQSATFSFTVNSVNGFSDPLEFGCGETANGKQTSGLTCSFSPSTATFDATGKLTGQVTVRVVSRPTLAPAPPKNASSALLGAVLPLILVCAGGIFIARKNKRAVGMLVLCVAIIVGFASCGGGGGGGGGGPTPTPTPIPTPTPTPGPAVVTVTVLGFSTVEIQAPGQPMASFTVTVQ